MSWCFSTRASVATVLLMRPSFSSRLWVNTMKCKQNEWHFADWLLQINFLDRKCLNCELCVPSSPIDNTSMSVKVMAWHRTGGKPLPESILIKIHVYMCFELLYHNEWMDKPISGPVFLNTAQWNIPILFPYLPHTISLTYFSPLMELKPAGKSAKSANPLPYWLTIGPYSKRKSSIRWLHPKSIEMNYLCGPAWHEPAIC